MFIYAGTRLAHGSGVYRSVPWERAFQQKCAAARLV